ncbi:hypothetical protein [Mycobacterium sp. JS623]|uniref:hypothetical protein n=1 Tax=Mycobacterium sp. JS623 TaxID=212767 RepID=UPI00059EB88D|nr:hypothetical protein [Mycobacterium sp. JS623]
MPRGDLSGRFDYLFEPLEVDDSAGDGHDEGPDAPAADAGEGRWSRRIVLTGVVVATLVAAITTAVVLLQPAQPAPQIITPTDATTSPTTMPMPTSSAMPAPLLTVTEPPVPVLPATISTSVVVAPTAAPPPLAPPQEQPTTVASAPPATMPPPTTRAPISVSPETRTPFPNQPPPGNNDQRGGLLGGLGGLL